MRDDGLCSIQEYNAMKSCIIDAIDEWRKFYDSDTKFGLAITPSTHKVEIFAKDKVKNPVEWYEIAPLIDEDGEANVSAVMDLTDTFCFVG